MKYRKLRDIEVSAVGIGCKKAENPLNDIDDS